MAFVNEVNKYPGLIDIIFGIEGMVKQRGSHASGVILNDENPYEFLAYMKTPDGEIISQFDLHTAEKLGATKYDFLVTSVQDKITECIRLLQKYNEIDVDLSLKEVYDKYFHPEIIDIEDNNVWSAIQQNKVLNVFQFDSDVGAQAAKKIKPSNMRELADSNGLMRLMAAEKGAETPMDKYIRYKNNISLWYQEMEDFGLTKEEQKILEPYFLSSYGVPPSQEQLMLMLMDENICNFSIGEANKARKIVGKKLVKEVPALHQKVLDRAPNKKFGEYVWKYGLGPQMSYSFSVIHALAYSFIGYQTAYLATKWNPIYWNTACLIVNSGSLADSDKNADYAKIAKAIGDIKDRNVNVSLIDINKSQYSFEPNEKENTILYGLKALSNINDEIIEHIIESRPYVSIKDFMNKCPLKKPAMINLIKGGAFDNLPIQEEMQSSAHSRVLTMIYYLSYVSKPKKKLTLQNFSSLLKYNLLPAEVQPAIDLFKFNKKLKTHKYKTYYFVTGEDIDFFLNTYYDFDSTHYDYNDEHSLIVIDQKCWNKYYTNHMDIARNYIIEHQQELLTKLNNILFLEQWNDYAEGTLSKWEMDSLCFYYHAHELRNIDYNCYGLQNFSNMPREPRVERTWKRKGVELPIYVLSRICGTVIAKDDNHSNIYLLTPEMKVITVKFTRDQYAVYKKQISEKQADGTKKVKEKSWFTRGTKLMLTGFRREDTFVIKTYKNTATHSVYKIFNIDNNGKVELTHERYNALDEL